MSKTKTLVKFHKTAAHQRYRLKDGTIVPGATTILNVIDKPQLLAWAWKCGIAGEDYKKIKDAAASVGTLAHWMCELHLKTLTDPKFEYVPDLSEFSKADIEKAETSFLKFLEWWEGNQCQPMPIKLPGQELQYCEVQMVSEEFGYGGTLDCPFIDRNGKKVLGDFKTSKGIYQTMGLQLASYSHLLPENTGETFDRHMIIRIGKEDAGDFEVREYSNLDREWEAFKAANLLHKALGKLKG